MNFRPRWTLSLFAIASLLGSASLFAQAVPTRWVVIFNQQNSLPSQFDRRVTDAGGTILTTIPQIGALVATSSSADFATKMSSDPSVADVSPDLELQMIPTPGQMGVQYADLAAQGTGPAEATGDDTQTGPEPYYVFQWDKKRMRASTQGSYSVQLGRPEVVVAVLDTGVDVLPVPHQDIAPKLDFARSRSFYPVAANPDGNPLVAAWDDKNGHGSWCQSAVGAPINGRGISGVAPNVTRVALKVLGDNGSGSYVSLAQALVYCGVNKFDVASMSLGNYLSKSNQGQHALIKLVERAVNFARSNGVTPIAALGNR